MIDCQCKEAWLSLLLSCSERECIIETNDAARDTYLIGPENGTTVSVSLCSSIHSTSAVTATINKIPFLQTRCIHNSPYEPLGGRNLVHVDCINIPGQTRISQCCSTRENITQQGGKDTAQASKLNAPLIIETKKAVQKEKIPLSLSHIRQDIHSHHRTFSSA